MNYWKPYENIREKKGSSLVMWSSMKPKWVTFPKSYNYHNILINLV
jgi:hypothetical protein